MQFDWRNPYPTVRSPLMARNAVATSQPLAAQAGLRMLLKGGNAIDAAIAAAAALTVVEPISNGLGSDNFAIVWDGKELHGMNSSGVAPAGWSKAYFDQKHGGQIPLRGFDAVTVPGAVAGWAALSERFGALPFADLLEPAIELAEGGAAVAMHVAIIGALVWVMYGLGAIVGPVSYGFLADQLGARSSIRLVLVVQALPAFDGHVALGGFNEKRVFWVGHNFLSWLGRRWHCGYSIAALAASATCMYYKPFWFG